MEDFSPLTLSGIAHRCKSEKDRYYRGEAFDPRYCFELFRRALQESDQQAWEAVVGLFSGLAAGWVRMHQAFPRCSEEIQYFLNGAFARMWTALSGEKFEAHRHLGDLLSYLKLCIHSEIIDHLRAQKSRDDPISLEDDEPRLPSTINHPGNQAMPALDREIVRKRVLEQLKDERERVVIYASFFLDYKPGEILTAYPGMFQDVDDVYRVKENLLARLKRSDALRQLV